MTFKCTLGVKGLTCFRWEFLKVSQISDVFNGNEKGGLMPRPWKELTQGAVFSQKILKF